jgi:hypothetical protein
MLLVRNEKFQKCAAFFALPCLSVRLSACLTRGLLNDYFTRSGIQSFITICQVLGFVKNRARQSRTLHMKTDTRVSAHISSITCQNIYRSKKYSHTKVFERNVIRPIHHSRKYCGCRDNYVFSGDLQF